MEKNMSAMPERKEAENIHDHWNKRGLPYVAPILKEHREEKKKLFQELHKGGKPNAYSQTAITNVIGEGWDKSKLSNIENGAIPMTYPLLVKIANALGVKPADVLIQSARRMYEEESKTKKTSEILKLLDKFQKHSSLFE